MKGGHWLTTERGWCKAGSIMQVSEGVYCKTTRGDTDHPAYSAGSSTSYPDQRGCVTGFGWSRATGRGRSNDTVSRDSCLHLRVRLPRSATCRN